RHRRQVTPTHGPAFLPRKLTEPDRVLLEVAVGSSGWRQESKLKIPQGLGPSGGASIATVRDAAGNPPTNARCTLRRASTAPAIEAAATRPVVRPEMSEKSSINRTGTATNFSSACHRASNRTGGI